MILENHREKGVWNELYKYF